MQFRRRVTLCFRCVCEAFNWFWNKIRIFKNSRWMKSDRYSHLFLPQAQQAQITLIHSKTIHHPDSFTFITQNCSAEIPLPSRNWTSRQSSRPFFFLYSARNSIGKLCPTGNLRQSLILFVCARRILYLITWHLLIFFSTAKLAKNREQTHNKTCRQQIGRNSADSQTGNKLAVRFCILLLL